MKKNPHAVALGRKGGAAPHKKPRGFAAMDPERRREIAKAAAVKSAEARRKRDG